MKKGKLENLLEILMKKSKSGETERYLRADPGVAEALSKGILAPFLGRGEDLAVLALAAIGQAERIFSPPGERPSERQAQELIARLGKIDRFYAPLGGVVGYHHTFLQLLGTPRSSPPRLTAPPLLDVEKEGVDEGIEALEELAEIYPIGGLGVRLNLTSESGESLPVAMLPFAGRSLLEGLIRDVEAREHLFFRKMGRKITIPIAIMTSLAKRNNDQIEMLFEQKGWFGRDKESIRIFSQPSVPVISKQGEWVLEAPYELKLAPGGHGALWRTALDEGIFDWFQALGKKRLLVRQINNPIGGIDRGLLSLVGIGKREKKTFGFASCPRLPGAAEGALVIKNEASQPVIGNVEYTELNLEECSFPANTNILYASIERLLPVIESRPLPGLMVNLKESEGGRLESMMQNISDALDASDVFVTHAARRRTLSVAKLRFEAGKNELETPESAFYDLLYNGYELARECGVTLDPFCSFEAYLKAGPSHLFLYHPALGPLFSEIASKIRGGKWHSGCEVELEVAELDFEEVEIEGSLRVLAQAPLTSRCTLKQVKVRNEGIDRKKTRKYWDGSIERKEALTIILEEGASFYAENQVFEGGKILRVRAGEDRIFV